mmetsp:Transcript_30085/g.94371  ORF Transcript_30085/g.94371 Transcript_30085/m.94371 type:complete len:218 (+) Transcript_30085:461-1114(+)
MRCSPSEPGANGSDHSVELSARRTLTCRVPPGDCHEIGASQPGAMTPPAVATPACRHSTTTRVRFRNVKRFRRERATALSGGAAAAAGDPAKAAAAATAAEADEMERTSSIAAPRSSLTSTHASLPTASTEKEVDRPCAAEPDSAVRCSVPGRVVVTCTLCLEEGVGPAAPALRAVAGLQSASRAEPPPLRSEKGRPEPGGASVTGREPPASYSARW